MNKDLKDAIELFIEVCTMITISLAFLTGLIYLIDIIGKEIFKNFILIIIYIIISIGTSCIITIIYYFIKKKYKNLKLWKKK